MSAFYKRINAPGTRGFEDFRQTGQNPIAINAISISDWKINKALERKIDSAIFDTNTIQVLLLQSNWRGSFSFLQVGLS